VSIIASRMLAELKEWHGHNEGDAWASERIAHYWRSLNQSFPGVATAWSAAFLVSVINSVAPGTLELTGAHIYYVRTAFKRRQRNLPGYWAFDPATTSPGVGDIVVRSRGPVVTTWKDIETGVGDFRPTHGDLVIERDARRITAIGGNVGTTNFAQGVQARDYALNAQGLLEGPGWIAVLKLSSADLEKTPVEGVPHGFPLSPPLPVAGLRSGLQHIADVANNLLKVLPS